VSNTAWHAAAAQQVKVAAAVNPQQQLLAWAHQQQSRVCTDSDVWHVLCSSGGFWYCIFSEAAAMRAQLGSCTAVAAAGALPVHCERLACMHANHAANLAVTTADSSQLGDLIAMLKLLQYVVQPHQLHSVT
jgi:hypothetical protein